MCAKLCSFIDDDTEQRTISDLKASVVMNIAKHRQRTGVVAIRPSSPVRDLMTPNRTKKRKTKNINSVILTELSGTAEPEPAASRCKCGEMELAFGDLEKYRRALYQALITFDTMKISSVNRTIKYKWQNAYRGTESEDIEVTSAITSRRVTGPAGWRAATQSTMY